MTKPFKKTKVTNSVLVAITICFFVLSKSRQTLKQVENSLPTPTPAQEAMVTDIQAIAEVSPLSRIFSKQLNRKKTLTRTAFTKIRTKKRTHPELVKLSETGLNESPQGSVFNVDPYESLTSLDPQFSLAASIPRENPVNIHEGVLVAQGYREVWDHVRSYPEAPRLVQSRKALPQESPSPLEKAGANLLTQKSPGSGSADVSPSVTPSPSLLEAPQLTENRVEPSLSTQSLMPKLAAPSEVSDLIQKGKSLLKRLSPQLEPTRQPANSLVSSQRNHSNKNLIPGVESSRVSTEPIGKIYGKLTFDSETQDWIDSLKGHVELRLQRINSQDPQDMFFVDYRYPERDFSWEGRQVTGEYQLIASFFEPSKPVAFAQINYSSPLNAETAKQMVVFHIKKNQVREAMNSASAQRQEGVVLSGTVFESNTGDSTNSKTIDQAEVSVVGFPEWGSFPVEKDGTFRISAVAPQSEYILSVTAPGYYPTEVVAPVFHTTGYVSIHLVSKNHVDTITRFFTKRSQNEQKAIIFGRVFDPKTRAPQSDQEISLTGRKGKPLYFGILPDKALNRTSDSGVFAYFNVDPTFRSVGRVENSAYELLQVRPGSAYHIELGRSGEFNLKGRLFDPYRQQAVMGTVKVVGSPLVVDSNEIGEFEISGIDLSPGILTLEVESPGYPLSWHTLSWSPRDRKELYTLYLPEEDLLSEVRTGVAKVSNQIGTGTILGGAQPEFFKDLKKCIYVSLEDSLGSAVAPSAGPFPLHRGDYESSKPLCLTKGRPGFSFFNLSPGQYLLKWKTRSGKLLRTHVVRVGSERTTILIN